MNALMTPLEIIASQGWPVHAAPETLPLPLRLVTQCLREIPLSAFVKMAGNGMNAILFGHTAVKGLSSFEDTCAHAISLRNFLSGLSF